MADGTTTNYGLTKPEVGASTDTWGAKLNANLDTLDEELKDVSDVADGALPKAGGTMTGNIVLSGAPSVDLHPASKLYVDTRTTQLISVNTQTDSYTLVLGDAGGLVESNKGTANDVTVPPNSSVAFPLKTRIDLVQYGAGQATVVAGSGVTIRSRNGLKLSGQYAGASLYKRATDEWVLIGDTTT
jgi:hypothetical protein